MCFVDRKVPKEWDLEVSSTERLQTSEVTQPSEDFAMLAWQNHELVKVLFLPFLM